MLNKGLLFEKSKNTYKNQYKVFDFLFFLRNTVSPHCVIKKKASIETKNTLSLIAVIKNEENLKCIVTEYRVKRKINVFIFAYFKFLKSLLHCKQNGLNYDPAVLTQVVT